MTAPFTKQKIKTPTNSQQKITTGNSCLTWEDFQCIHSEDFVYRRRYCDGEVKTDEPRRWAEILFVPGDVIEFRLRPPRQVTESMGRRKFMQAKTSMQHGIYRWAFANEIDVLANKLLALNHGDATWWGVWDKIVNSWTDVEGEAGIPLNIYASANPRIATGYSKNEDVLLARSLFVDIENISVEEAIAKVAAAGLPMPTMTVGSGHGVHLYWRLIDPIFDLEIWTNIEKRLIVVCQSDRAIHDPARIMRVPGFNNVNGETPTRCYIHEADAGRRYSLDDILPHLPPEPQPTTKSDISDKRPSNTDIATVSVYGKSSEYRHRAKAYADKFEPVEEDRNSTAYERTCALVEKFDLEAAEVLPLIEKVNDKANDPLDEDELNEVFEKAVRHVRRKGKPRGTALNKTCRVEKYCEPTKDKIELDIWRKQLAECRLESLGKYGSIFFDGSTTGAGKSTADLTAIKEANQSAIFLPTHDACEELAAILNRNELSAAAHPPLDGETCGKFGTKNAPGPAQLALAAGLNVGQCICTTCDLFKQCEYQKRRDIARSADHTIATHSRASLSNFESAKDKPIVFIHEDVTNLFRPTVKVFQHAAKHETPQVRHLLDVLRIAQAAEDIATTWSDEQAIAFSRTLKTDTNALITELDSPELVKAMEDASNLRKDFADLQSVKPIKLKPSIDRHDRLDYLLNRAMDRVGIRANGTALKLALAYSLGELDQLCVVVDDIKDKGGNPVFTKALVGVWKVLPPDHCVVWIENASTTAQTLEELVGRKIVDKTPNGRLEYKLPPVQFPDVDITRQSCGNTVRSVVRGLLAKYPDAKKVGIISHKCHQAELDLLDPMWSRRISRKEYFRSGKDRASNSWLDYDLILVIGTPRVPKYAVRDLLIQTGKMDAACRNAQFGGVSWEGKTIDGNLVKIDGVGYDDPDWANAYDQLVKETLRQAIGRGRGVTEKGVQVLVASNESLDLPLADLPLRLVNDSEDVTLQLTVSATARNAKYNTLANGAVNFVVTDTVARLSQYERRTVRDHLSSLSLSGLLKKKGERKGWIVADWLLNGMTEY